MSIIKYSKEVIVKQPFFAVLSEWLDDAEHKMGPLVVISLFSEAF